MVSERSIESWISVCFSRYLDTVVDTASLHHGHVGDAPASIRQIRFPLSAGELPFVVELESRIKFKRAKSDECSKVT